MKRRPTNALTLAQSYQLSKWLDDNWDTAKIKLQSMNQAAENAQTDLGFTVTDGNIKGALKATGRTWRTVASNGGGVMWQAIKALEDRIESLESEEAQAAAKLAKVLDELRRSYALAKPLTDKQFAALREAALTGETPIL